MFSLKKLGLIVIVMQCSFVSLIVPVASLKKGQASLELVDPSKEVDSGLLKIKEGLIEGWLDSFSGVMENYVFEKKFNSQTIGSVANSIEDIDLIEIISRLNGLGFAFYFKNNPAIFELIEQSVESFFAATYDFMSLFNLLKESYYKDRKLAVFIKVTMWNLIDKNSELGMVWESLLEIASNNSSLDDLELLASNYFETIKPSKKGVAWMRAQNFVDYVFSQKACELHLKNLEEYKKIQKIFLKMSSDGWLEKNPWFSEKFFLTKPPIGLPVEMGFAIISDKFMMANNECSKSINKASKSFDKIHKKLKKLELEVSKQEKDKVFAFKKTLKKVRNK